MERQRSVPNRCRHDDGAVIIELAFVAPLMLMLVLGIFEFGFALRERANLTAALRGAQRADTVNGAARSADYDAILAFEAGMARSVNIRVNFIVIYQTDSSGAPPRASCLTPVSTTGCNYYSAAALASIGGASSESAAGMGAPADVSCLSTAPDANYCPATRTERQSASGGPDWVGFYVNATYTSYTGMLPATQTWTDTSLARLDPQPGS